MSGMPPSRRTARPTVATAVLVSGLFGALQMHARCAAGPLGRGRPVTSVDELAALLDASPPRSGLVRITRTAARGSPRSRRGPLTRR